MKLRMMIVTLLLVTMALPAAAQRRYRQNTNWHSSRPSPFQVVIEGAAAIPGGDLGDDFIGTDKGMGATTGYEFGGRLRYHASSVTSIGPAVHYADFGNWDDVFADGTAYSVKTSVLRIGLDLQQFMAPQGVPVRPYLTAGVALCRNRYVDWVQDDGEFESTSNNLAASVGGGVAFGPMEMSVLYTFNPVRNRELPVSDDALDHDFNWNYLVVRAGISFGD